MRFKHWFENIFSQPSADEIHSAQGFWRTAIDAVHMGHFRSVNQALAAVAVHQLEIQSPEEVGRELGICLRSRTPVKVYNRCKFSPSSKAIKHSFQRRNGHSPATTMNEVSILPTRIWSENCASPGKAAIVGTALSPRSIGSPKPL